LNWLSNSLPHAGFRRDEICRVRQSKHGELKKSRCFAVVSRQDLGRGRPPPRRAAQALYFCNLLRLSVVFITKVSLSVSENLNDPAACAQNLRRAVSQLARKLRPNLRHEGIGAATLSVIGQIHRAGRLTPSELAHREGVKIQSLTRLLNELESLDWVRREPDPRDRRRSWLSLTRSGHRTLVMAATEHDRRLAELIATFLDAEERKLIIRACLLLERLDKELGHATNDYQEPSPRARPTRRRATQ
jgi:DNA-binding MarR family transcriptional regulator